MSKVHLKGFEPELPPTQGWRRPSTWPVWVEFVIDEDTSVALRFQDRNGLPVVTEIRVYPDDGDPTPKPGTWSVDSALAPENGISPTVIHNLALGRLRDQAVTALLQPTQDWRTSEEDDWEDLAANWLDISAWASVRQGWRPPQSPSRRGRKLSITDEQLAEVAFHYQAAARKGVGIHRYIQQRMPEIDTVVGNRISKARDRGMLLGGGGERGLKGGYMSNRAVDLLRASGRLRELQEQEEQE